MTTSAQIFEEATVPTQAPVTGEAYSPVNTLKEINYPALLAAKEEYFPAEQGVTYPEFMKKSERFYRSLNLDQRGCVWNDRDREMLEISIGEALRRVRAQASSMCPPTGRMLVIGSGDGRLVEPYLRICEELEIKEIVFNDLLPSHIEETRKRVDQLTFDRNKIAVDYVAGDFSKVQIEGRFDIALAMFFVTSEVLDLTSAEALNAVRSDFFMAVRARLHPSGVFIEDTPEVTLKGFYRRLREASARALVNVQGLEGEERNFTLTALEKSTGEYPFHVRFMPVAERHTEEREAHGFKSLKGWTVHAPGHRGINRRWKRIELWGV